MDKKAITTFIISIALGAILYIRLLSLGEPPSRGDGGIIEGFLRVMFVSIAAGVVAGFFAGKNIIMSIKAAVIGVIIGSTLFISISYSYGYDLPVWFPLLYGAALVFVILIVIPAIRGEGWARKTAIIGSILLLAIFSIYFYNRSRYYYYYFPTYHYPTWFDIIYSLTLNFIIFIIIPAIIGGTVGGWVRKHRPY